MCLSAVYFRELQSYCLTKLHQDYDLIKLDFSRMAKAVIAPAASE
jgi:hypothetical protein